MVHLWGPEMEKESVTEWVFLMVLEVEQKKDEV